MRLSTLLPGVLAAVSAGSALWMWHELQNERARTESLEFVIAQGNTAEPPQAAAHAPSESAPASPAPSAAVAPAIASGAADAPPRSGPRYSLDQRRQMLNNPAFRKAYRGQQRAMIEATYHDLQKALGLSPEKAAAVFDLMAEQAVDQYGNGRRPAGDADASQRRLAYDEQRRKNDAAMTDLLGQSGMEQLRDYRKSYQSRTEVNQLRSELSAGSDPLRDDQFEPMLAIVYAEQQRVDQEISDYESTLSADDMGTGVIDTKRADAAVAANGRILDSARAVLSTNQLAALTEFYRLQNQRMKAESDLIRLSNEAMIQATQAAKANSPDR